METGSMANRVDGSMTVLRDRFTTARKKHFIMHDDQEGIWQIRIRARARTRCDLNTPGVLPVLVFTCLVLLLKFRSSGAGRMWVADS